MEPLPQTAPPSASTRTGRQHVSAKAPMQQTSPFDPLAAGSLTQQELMARLAALGIDAPEATRALLASAGAGADAPGALNSSGSRVLLTVALGQALGADVSTLVDAQGRVLCPRREVVYVEGLRASEAAAIAALPRPQPRFFERLRRARVLRFDTERYRLREALAAVLELDRFLERRLQHFHAAHLLEGL
ncbi:hypothetical protein T492DRAFT_904733 [Pavlovales sp. CCMP2436]|nr:hypothetical protein T492DRAFT_904733 [Pavlovales sp. CCMP2436]